MYFFKIFFILQQKCNQLMIVCSSVFKVIYTKWLKHYFLFGTFGIFEFFSWCLFLLCIFFLLPVFQCSFSPHNFPLHFIIFPCAGPCAFISLQILSLKYLLLKGILFGNFLVTLQSNGLRVPGFFPPLQSVSFI